MSWEYLHGGEGSGDWWNLLAVILVLLVILSGAVSPRRK